MNSDLRLIEDYLPIEAISAEASREKSVRKGHISTLHLWWARRPLVACRAAVYGALVPADRWVKDVDVKNPTPDATKAAKVASGKKKGLNRKAAKEFVTKLCRYPKTDPTNKQDIKVKNDTEAAIVEAQKHILEAHADRLTAELAEGGKAGKPPAWVKEFGFTGDKVTCADIVAGRAPRPRVLDMFAGGGAIPLEALRLGCEAYALDLNPVAHIIQLCTLVYPQKYGKPDPVGRGMTGPKNAKGETTWGGLAAEVRYWGNWVLGRVRKEIGDLYPPIPDPAVWGTSPDITFDQTTGQWNISRPGKPKRGVKLGTLATARAENAKIFDGDDGDDGDGDSSSANVQVPAGFLQPVAYLWTRTVRCKNPGCAKQVPLVRQTWLCQKKGRYVALRPVAEQKTTAARFDVVESTTETGLGFDAEGLSTGGNATCPWCGSIADSDYVKREGCEKRIDQQLMAIACTRPGTQGKVFVSSADVPNAIPLACSVADRLHRLCARSSITPPDEKIEARMTGGICLPYGLTDFGRLVSDRQMLSLLTFASAVRESGAAMRAEAISNEREHCLVTFMGLAMSRMANFSTTLCLWNYTGGRGVVHSFSRQALPMTWDFPESNPFYWEAAGWEASVRAAVAVFTQLPFGYPAVVSRGSATEVPFADAQFDAVITDPPYYDNIDYAKLADFFYVWLKRSVGHLHPEHFSTANTPKKNEIVADPVRYGGSRERAKQGYEQMMSQAFAEASRVLKPAAPMAVVYAHKTTLGWSTLIDALRRTGFMVNEAWPLDTERPGGMKVDKAMLASSIFLVARKRAIEAGTGNYEDDVQPELQQIVRERVETLWDMDIVGADLVIACVGAGLRAFTKYEKVEYANGEEVPAERFLAEVEGVVLDTMMGKLSGVVGGNVSAVDNVSRFYVLWRFVYKTSDLQAGEAIVFSNGTHTELDGPLGLSTGTHALVEKNKANYRARDYTERGDNTKLGLPSEDGQPAPLIDALHRILWLMENSPRKLNEFLDEARSDRERLRVLAQALAGAALSGKSEEESVKLVSTTPAEQSALGKLLANWRSLIEIGAAIAVVGKKAAKEDKESGQGRFEFGEGGKKPK